MSARDLPEDLAREELARAEALIAGLFAEYMAPPARLTVTEWAEKNRILSAKDSSEPGPYRVARTPYAREPQDALSAMSTVQEVILMWGAQTSKTTIANNWIGYQIDTQPGPLMIVQPTLNLAKRYSRQRLAPMIEESPVLKRKVRENRSRDDSNTTLLKEYAGGYLAIAGANSAADLRSMPIRDIVFDEVDGYPMDVDGEGDPVALAEARQTSFARRRRLKTSTPTLKDVSRIEDAYLASDRRRYQVPCPECGELQVLEWGADKPYGVKWDKDALGQAVPETAHYRCRHSGCIIREHHKPAMLAAGRWVAENPGAPSNIRGYHLSSIYSPLGWLSWPDLVKEWVKARDKEKVGDASLMKTFVNTRLAETFEAAGDKVSQSELVKRASDRPLGVVPWGGLMVTQGVDVQPDRLERRVWGFGRGEASWLVDVEIIHGDPNVPEEVEGSPWRVLTERIRTPLQHAAGTSMLIEATGIDTGGHNTSAVYNYCRAHTHRHVLALKGASQPGRAPLGKPKAVDVTWRGKTLAASLKLWQVGTDTIKHLLYGRLRLDQPGPGYVDLPKAITKGDEIEQLTCERLVTAYVKGNARLEWHKPPGKRNEALDCAVYAYAVACFLGLQRLREPDWQRRAQRYAPEADLFASLQQADPVPHTATEVDEEDDEPESETPPQPPPPPPPPPRPARRAPSPSPFASEAWSSRL